MHNRKISVIGLGYVGLPVLVAFARQKKCIGFDINHQRISELKQGIDCNGEVLKEEINNVNILYTNHAEDLKGSDFFIVTVPTPIDDAHNPLLDAIKEASQIIGKVLKIGGVVVYESTVYPGVTEELCIPILETESRLRCGVDFKVGYSPERINPGDREHSFTNIKKIVAACDDEALKIIADVYSSVITAGVHEVSSIKVAEAAKVIENTQRDLNIALMNELAVIFERMNIDTIEVLEAAGTKWNFLPFRPGLVGGHCIGVDPYYLTHKAELLGYLPQVILAVRRINDNMGRYIARRAVKWLIKRGHSTQNLTAIVLGITFKENCSDIRNSKVIDIINELQDYNINVLVHDPHANQMDSKNEYNIPLTNWENLPKVDLLILAVAHDEYKKLELPMLLAKVNPNAIIFDVKSILSRAEVENLGYTLLRL